jgi:hypothetical protein
MCWDEKRLVHQWGLTDTLSAMNFIGFFQDLGLAPIGTPIDSGSVD